MSHRSDYNSFFFNADDDENTPRIVQQGPGNVSGDYSFISRGATTQGNTSYGSTQGGSLPPAPANVMYFNNNGIIDAEKVYIGHGLAAGRESEHHSHQHQRTNADTTPEGDLFLGRQTASNAPTDLNPAGSLPNTSSFRNRISVFKNSIFDRQSSGARPSTVQTRSDAVRKRKESPSGHNGDSTAWQVSEKDEIIGEANTTTAYREVKILNGKKGTILGGLSVGLKTIIGPTSELVVVEHFDTTGDVDLTGKGKLSARTVTVEGTLNLSDSSEVQALSADPSSIRSLVMAGNSVMKLSGGGNVTLPAVKLSGNATIDLLDVVLSAGSVFEASDNATIYVKPGTDTTHWKLIGWPDIIYTRPNRGYNSAMS